jgi:hypothetical protein
MVIDTSNNTQADTNPPLHHAMGTILCASAYETAWRWEMRAKYVFPQLRTYALTWQSWASCAVAFVLKFQFFRKKFENGAQ